jgi:hypothetical protein
LKISCSTDSLIFNEFYSITFCGQLGTSLAYESCFNTLDISLITTGPSDSSLVGVSIYYEMIPRPIDFVCTQPTIKPTIKTTARPTTTTITTTTTTAPSYLGW